MKILILADINSSHTQKWAKGLALRGMTVGIFSFSYPRNNWYEQEPAIEVCYIPEQSSDSSRISTKLGYLSKGKDLKQVLGSFKPDIIHAHYATSYGLLAARSKFHPFVLSVWGSDVYEFPRSGIIQKLILKYIFRKADVICSTSHNMAEEISKYTNKSVQVIPFGLNTSEYEFRDRQPIGQKDEIVIGTVKALEYRYGTDYLIRAFNDVQKHLPGKKLRLLLVGSGSKEASFKQLVKELDLDDRVTFTGQIPHSDIPQYHKRIDIFAGMTTDNESFGVSLIESMASGAAVIATDVAGYKEILGEEDEYGLLIHRKSEEDAGRAIKEILTDPDKAKRRSDAAMKSIKDRYEWQHNLDAMIDVYNRSLKKS